MPEVIDAARLMNRYCRHYHAGAFGSPTATELAKPNSGLRIWEHPGADRGLVAAVIRRAGKAHVRTDWTGRRWAIPEGATYADHLARDPRAPFPRDLLTVDFITGYVEDYLLRELMRSDHRPIVATRISASSEILTTWGPRGYGAHKELPADRPTCLPLGGWILENAAAQIILAELEAVQEWHDDYPFYSDGSWGAVNLRGFKPDDPLWGVKPAEMPRTWQRKHPEAMSYTCDWTTITDRLPAMRALIESVHWWRNLERVRLMRMAAKPGGGKLARHSDVTDRAAGTADGKIARFHIPLVTHPDITMTCWDLDGSSLEVHLRPWEVYYLDQRKPHAVTNPTDVDRIHLVVDVVCDPEVRKHLEAT